MTGIGEKAKSRDRLPNAIKRDPNRHAIGSHIMSHLDRVAVAPSNDPGIAICNSTDNCPVIIGDKLIGKAAPPAITVYVCIYFPDAN